VQLRLLDDLPGDYAFGPQTVAGAAPFTTATFDTTRAAALLVLESLGSRFRGCELEVDGEAAPPGTKLEAIAALPTSELPADRAVGGRPVELASLAGVLRAPRADVSLRLYLLGPTGALAWDVAAGSAVELPPAIAAQLRYAADVLGGCALHWFWQTLPGAVEPWCSRFDHCLLHARRD
jgi:hypothetical protein